MCAYYICIIVLCITCVGHVSLSMCIFLYVKSLVLCYKISVVCYVQCILASLSSLTRNRIFNHFCIQVPGKSWAVGFRRHSFVEYIHSNSTARTHSLLLLFLGNGELLLWYRCCCWLSPPDRFLLSFWSRRCALPSSGLNDAYERKREQDRCSCRLSQPDRSLFVLF